MRKLLSRGAITLGDQSGRKLGPSDKGLFLQTGARLSVTRFRPVGAQRVIPEPDAPLTVLAEAAGWLAIDKPAGTPVHPLQEDETGTVSNAVAARYPEVHGVGEGGLRSGVLHRLDVDTSGVLLMATGAEAWERLRAAFREHRIEKVYRAVVLGRVEVEQQVEVGLIVARHRPAKVRVVALSEFASWPGARLAGLRLRPLEVLSGVAGAGPDCSLVEVQPRTGFLHQIRATLAHLGHPVAGDSTYGPGPEADPADRPEASCAPPRQLLHAARISYEDSLGSVRAESPDRVDFCSAIASVRARDH